MEAINLNQVKVLRSMRQLRLEDVVVGQYKGHSKGGKTYPAYVDDPTVPSGSITPTFAAAALFIDNARWDGVPFLMKAGKALHTRRSVQSLLPHSCHYSIRFIGPYAILIFFLVNFFKF